MDKSPSWRIDCACAFSFCNWDSAEFPFSPAEDTASFVCCQVLAAGAVRHQGGRERGLKPEVQGSHS